MSLLHSSTVDSIPGLDYTYPANRVSLCLPRKIGKIEGDTALRAEQSGKKTTNMDWNHSIVLGDGLQGSSFVNLRNTAENLDRENIPFVALVYFEFTIQKLD